MGNSSRIHQIARFASLSLIIALLLVPGIARAYMATQYATDTDFSLGTVIAFDSDGKPVTALFNTFNYVGVVSGKGQGTIDVANSGTVNVLVSDADGSVVAGSHIGLSIYAGIGTLWQTDRKMIGIVVKTIDATSSDWHPVKIKDKSGAERTIRIAQVPVQLIQDTGTGSSAGGGLVGSIQQVANNLVGHSVAIWQVIASLITGLGSLILAFGLLFSSGRESFLSLGRNPLASKVILRGMWRIVAVSITIMVLGLAITYLILRLGS